MNENQKIWNPTYHLNHINNDLLERAKYLVENGFIKNVKIEESKSIIEYYQLNACSVNVYKNLEHLKKCDKPKTTTADLTAPIRTCSSCTCLDARCLIRLAGYIQYLQDNNILQEVLDERNSFIKENHIDGILYNFSINEDTLDYLDYLPETYYRLAIELKEKNLVTIQPYLTEKGRITINFTGLGNCKFKYKEAKGNIQNIICSLQQFSQNQIDMKRGFAILPTGNWCKSACDNCTLGYCVYKIAAHLEYFCQIGRQDLIEKHRNIYNQTTNTIEYPFNVFNFKLSYSTVDIIKNHVLTVSDEILDISLDLLKNMKAELENEKYLEDVNNHKKEWYIISCTFDGEKAKQANTISEFNKIINQITENGSTTKLGGFSSYEGISIGGLILRTVIGIDYLQKTNVDIDELIKNRHKTMNALIETSNRIIGGSKILKSIENEKTDSFYCIIEGSRFIGKTNYIQDIANALSNKGKITSSEYKKMTMQQAVEFFTTHKTKAGYFDMLTSGYEYDTFKENTLYVLTGLDQFLLDYVYFKNTIDKETRNKSYKHFERILGEFKKNTYIIIVSLSEDATEQFLKINSKYNIMYGQNIVKFPNMTVQEIYERYQQSLSDEVINQISNFEEQKQLFFNYIAFNERFLPFKNAELADYLSNYSNSENAPILPQSIYDKRKTISELENIVGMDMVKQQLKEFETYISFQKKAQVLGLRISQYNMHMQFLGNPGTGKTTVARIIANMLYDIGVLKENKLIEVERKDLVAGYTGQTAIKTNEKIKEALGGILFIDEAYSLYLDNNDTFGKEAIATLIKAMEDHKDNLIIIFAGYEKEMHDFLKSNSGVESRIGYSFHFEDYNNNQLTEIYIRNLKKQGFDYDENILSRLNEIWDTYINRKNFGNGRFVQKVLQETIMKHASNSEKNNWKLEKITIQDIPNPNVFATKQSELKTIDLKNIIGLKSVKEQIEQLKDKIIFQQKVKDLGVKIPKGNSHMLFLGNPGTGKTTIARIIVNELYKAGIISEKKMIECSRKDLIAEYTGQTAVKTQGVIDRAIGGVLFIDEAYSLYESVNDTFGKESIATLIKAMEDYKDSFVVIFAGYKKEMKIFLEANSGIYSRIGYTFTFDDYTVEELTEIFRTKIIATGLCCEDSSVLDAVKDIMQYFSSVPNFGNGRFVDRISQLIYEQHSRRCTNFSDKENLLNISIEDIPSIKEIINKLPDGEDMIVPDEIKQEQLDRTAFHELGHALISKLYFPQSQIQRITISAEGNGTFGYVRHSGYGVGNKTATDLKKIICVNMAGIAAEEVFLQEYGNGGTSDLKNATNIAFNMLSFYGMSEKGFVYKNRTDEELIIEANKILSEQFEIAKTIIIKYRNQLEKIKEYLIKNKEISEEEFERFIKK